MLPFQKSSRFCFSERSRRTSFFGAQRPGISLALFFVLQTGVILFAGRSRCQTLQKHQTRLVIAISGLLFIACIATCLDSGFANFVVLFSLMLILFGALFFPELADYNVSQGARNPQHKLDVGYLSTLGASAYPALIRATHWPRCKARTESIRYLKTMQDREGSRMQNENWRSLQLRHRAYAQELLAEKLPEIFANDER